MLIIPAIDIRQGKVVRLTKGEFDHETHYSDNPVEILKLWEEAGAQVVHVVDLDGAVEGRQVNFPAIQSLLRSACAKIELGGGLRTLDSIALMIDAGVSRIVLGTKALDSVFLRQALHKFKESIVVGLDLRDGKIKTQGWLQESDLTLVQVLKELEQIGVQRIIVTDIHRDGTLGGPNISLLKKVLTATRMKVIQSGGISSLSDLEQLAGIKQKHLEGAIIGKALYEKKIVLKEAISRFQNN